MTPTEIREIRERLGDTQAAFARRLGYTRAATVSDWERGIKAPSPTTVLLIRHMADTAGRS